MFTRHTMAVTRSMARQRALISSTSRDQYKFKDHTDESKFKLHMDSAYAEIDYDKNGNVYDLIHTNVPVELQGQGIGHIIGEKAFDFIAAKNGRMKLTCEFLQTVCDKNQDKYKKLLE